VLEIMNNFGTAENDDGEMKPVGEMARCKPFLKWAGGKSKLLPELLARFPQDVETYFEPFLGGGSVFFGASPKRAVLADSSAELVNAFNVVRNDIDALLIELAGHKFTKSYFYRIRSLDRKSDFWVNSPVSRASRFIYLNHTCFNGLYRVNSRGEFNVPRGDYESPKIFDADNLRACSLRLQNVDIKVADFEEAVESVTSCDFIYFDPPYVPVSETSNFTSYSRVGFELEDQKRLADLTERLHSAGIRWMLSNSDTSFVRELYSKFRITEVKVARAINSKASKRGAVGELIVTNY
jgi:DNA adenine methylase